MSIVQFRWVNPKTDKTHIIGQFEIDWKFLVGNTSTFGVGRIRYRMYKFILIGIYVVFLLASYLQLK